MRSATKADNVKERDRWERELDKYGYINWRCLCGHRMRFGSMEEAAARIQDHQAVCVLPADVGR